MNARVNLAELKDFQRKTDRQFRWTVFITFFTVDMGNIQNINIDLFCP